MLMYDEADRLKAREKMDVRLGSIERAVADLRDELQGDDRPLARRAAADGAAMGGGDAGERGQPGSGAVTQRSMLDLVASVEKVQRTMSSLATSVEAIETRLKHANLDVESRLNAELGRRQPGSRLSGGSRLGAGESQVDQGEEGGRKGRGCGGRAAALGARESKPPR